MDDDGKMTEPAYTISSPMSLKAQVITGIQHELHYSEVRGDILWPPHIINTSCNENLWTVHLVRN